MLHRLTEPPSQQGACPRRPGCAFTGTSLAQHAPPPCGEARHTFLAHWSAWRQRAAAADSRSLRHPPPQSCTARHEPTKSARLASATASLGALTKQSLSRVDGTPLGGVDSAGGWRAPRAPVATAAQRLLRPHTEQREHRQSTMYTTEIYCGTIDILYMMLDGIMNYTGPVLISFSRKKKNSRMY